MYHTMHKSNSSWISYFNQEVIVLHIFFRKADIGKQNKKTNSLDDE